jgi:hypothetical protein
MTIHSLKDKSRKELVSIIEIQLEAYRELTKERDLLQTQVDDLLYQKAKRELEGNMPDFNNLLEDDLH